MHITNYIAWVFCMCAYCFGILDTQYRILGNGNVMHENAQTLCRDEGMEIAVPKTDSDWSELQQFIDVTDIQNHAWIGIYWNAYSQQFHWADNNAVVTGTIPWTPNRLEPNCMDNLPAIYTGCTETDISQNCVRIVADGTVRTAPCDRYYSVVCQNVFTTVTSDVTDELSSTTTSTLYHDTRQTTRLQSTNNTTSNQSLESQQCNCSCESVNSNLTHLSKEELKVVAIEQIKDILKEISIQKASTHAYINRKSCALDDRESSTYLGVFGATTIVIVLSFIMSLDCLSIYSSLKK